ncbi:MAG: DUF2085 domain-containing protein [Bacteroidetes Order II. Incertae sedis bacterium]|nr:DUF2085 domain-containing protein [Bacteroidetes Order II. bacterium]
MQNTNVAYLKAYLVTLLILFLWMLGPMMPWVLDEGGGVVWRFQYRYLCHQMPDRCFRMHGIPMAVCERCFGIYVGLFVGGLFYWPLKKWDHFLLLKARWLVGLAACLMFLDWLGPIISLWGNDWFTRSGTGFVLGIVCGYFAAKGMLQLILEIKRIKWHLLFSKPNQKKT